MKICERPLSDVSRYIDTIRDIRLEDREADFQSVMRQIGAFMQVDESTRILEIGTGSGWFPILCQKHGIRCKGVEISPQLVEYGREFGRRNGLEPDIEVGNIEDATIGEAAYDVVIALSVFEHVQHWQSGIDNVYAALRPGGVLHFVSTNKFAPVSGEYDFPIYGWLPDPWRYALRKRLQGDDIMESGIDFNQFTHPQLRRYFRKVGFSEVYDTIEILTSTGLQSPARWKLALWKAAAFPPLKHVMLQFASVTQFTCIR
jgi:2-polyprenyl-3-methyl-5-hydroxy-6-metoxy-1,4-benzoquinol methylase